MKEEKVVNFKETDEEERMDTNDNVDQNLELGRKKHLIDKYLPVVKTVGRIALCGTAMVIGYLVCAALIGSSDDDVEIEIDTDESSTLEDSVPEFTTEEKAEIADNIISEVYGDCK